MLFFILSNTGKVETVTTEYPKNVATFISRCDIKTLNFAEELAAECNTLESTDKYIATDSGPYCSPRYDVIERPLMGADVSRSFNGDSYPAGKIVKISASLKRIETDTGVVFFRRKQSGAWINRGTWSMIPGHVYEQNPSF